jgi:sugar phosphate isomerase/epimerase
METLSRREAGKILLAGTAGLLTAGSELMAAKKIQSIVRGVQIGSQSYSFRDRPLDACIEAFRTVGLGECELWTGHVEPRNLKREEIRKWHLSAPLSHFREIRQKWNNAGIVLGAYNYSFRSDMSDADLERGFIEAKELGVKVITCSSNVSVVPRVDKLAQKYKMRIGLHGHDATDRPDEFSNPDSFERAMKGASPYIGVNLDIGHFIAAGGEPVAYLRQFHARIVALHIKDRKKNHGANLPFGQGDTPIGEVLRLVRDQRWKIPANIEYEYGGPKSGLDPVAEVRKCYEYCRKQLES